MCLPRKWIRNLQVCRRKIGTLLNAGIYIGRCPGGLPTGAVVLFPVRVATLGCGLAGIITVNRAKPPTGNLDMELLEKRMETLKFNDLATCQGETLNLPDYYLGGQALLEAFLDDVHGLRRADSFLKIYANRELQNRIKAMAEDLAELIRREEQLLQAQMGHLDTEQVNIISARIEKVKDLNWCMTVELIDNISKIRQLSSMAGDRLTPTGLRFHRKVNAVLNSIDRLEVRGRDSAGISLLFILEATVFEQWRRRLADAGLSEELQQRCCGNLLVNRSTNISRHTSETPSGQVSVSITYKVAAEIGSLGDNVRFLRQQIQEDRLLQQLANLPHEFNTVSCHTRWASVGAITEPNCHPVDNATAAEATGDMGIIHACLNGDIDNYHALKEQLTATGIDIPDEITTDTKIIPLQIQKYVLGGHAIQEAFRLAVNDFQGSHAIAMHTDLAPGKFFLAQKGSGQAVFVGICEDHYMPTSEVYGFVEETSRYIKMEGEKVVEGASGSTQGQILIIDQDSAGGLEGLSAMYYDGTPMVLGGQDIKQTEITSRDIDRQNFPHYFLKEISESPRSVERTLQNRWKIKDNGERLVTVDLDQQTFAPSLTQAIAARQIRRIYFVGQGTAGVAALACSDLLTTYLNDPTLHVAALKASELSGFKLNESDGNATMSDCLVVAISQSGTTTDTNRTVDMVRARGAHTMAIVNRRDSDITFKVDGVLYTSSGRDIEMSVASTKAFYSQIVAGALLSLKIAQLMQRRGEEFISQQIRELLELPDHMRTVLGFKERIAASAQRLAATKLYWAAVGSGPNKAAADEIRIKLSELCYKTISSDFVEDKKHIDLSSEPLIIVCAAGAKGTVIGDIIKDTAIFKAHKAAPVVIADEGETRFDTYAEDVFYVPPVSEHLAPILNTLVGHLWGYYAALAINEGSRFLNDFRQGMHQDIDRFTHKGLDIFEVVLEKGFREKIAQFYIQFRQKRNEKRLPTAITHASDLALLLKYLSGRLPVADFEIDFGVKGTAANMVKILFQYLGESINMMSRPVDAIKHQAKTVTVGTSRISERVEGLLFDTLAECQMNPSQLITRNIIVMKHIQEIIAAVKGYILYRIDGLNLLGEPTEQTTIQILKKEGSLKDIPSRVETDKELKGTKRIIVRQGNVYIGKGRKDDRSIVVLPLISTDPASANKIEFLLLLNIAFKDDTRLETKIKALGGKYEHIKSIVQENSIKWQDSLLKEVPMDELFGRSAEKIGELIVKKINARAAVG